MLVKEVDGQAVKTSLRAIREENPTVDFPDYISNALLANFGVQRATIDHKDVPIGSVQVPTGELVKKGDRWFIDSVVREMTEGELKVLIAGREGYASEVCRQKIFEVADATAQMNLASAMAAGIMTTAQKATYRAGLAWIGEMRNTWRDIASDLTVSEGDMGDDTLWPEVPDGVAELCKAF